jgi:hypothetical protein
MKGDRKRERCLSHIAVTGNTQKICGVCPLGPGDRLFESVLLGKARSDCEVQQARSDDRSESLTYPVVDGAQPSPAELHVLVPFHIGAE